MMADGSVKNIEDVKIGEKVVGLNGINNVINLIRPLLGDRYLIELPGLLTSAEHLFWIKVDGKEQFGTNDYNQYIREKRISKTYVGLTKTEPYIITEAVDYKTLYGWINAYRKVLHNQHIPSMQLYQLETDGSHTYTANGYYVGGEVRDDDYDYYNV